VRNLATPDELRGRVAAAHSALAMGGPRLGEFQSGMTAAAIGPRAAMLAGGLAVIGVSVLFGWRVPAMTNYRLGDALEDEDASQWSAATTPAQAAAGGLPTGGQVRGR
jgi:hypothetical protein